MRISFERTGGFTGMRMTAIFDTDSMPPEEARHLREMVNSAGFFELPEFSPAPKRGADYFQYKLTVETEGRMHTIEMSEEAVPGALRPLLEWLMDAARKKTSLKAQR
ncbi:MAG: protealysin inhibitor emfourin [Methanosarcinales archaeon]